MSSSKCGRNAGLILVTALLLGSSQLSAQSLYMGASVWRASWNVGLADKQAENALNNAPITTALVNGGLQAILNSPFQFTTLFINDPADAQMTNVGVFGAYNFGGPWALSFNLSYGGTEFNSARTIVFNEFAPTRSCGTGCTQAGVDYRTLSSVGHQIEAERKDIDLVLARRLGDSGFSAFGGLKAQDWSYEAPFTNGVAGFNGSVTDLASPASGPMVGAAPALAGFEFSYKSRAIGPAAGVIYTFTIDESQALIAQLGGVFLFGDMEIYEANIVLTGDRTLTNGVNSFTRRGGGAFISDRISDRLWMPGYTAKLDYRIVVGDVILRAGAFYQETTVRSRAPSDQAFSVIFGEIIAPVPLSPRSLQSEYSVNGARDIFKGFSISATTKVF